MKRLVKYRFILLALIIVGIIWGFSTFNQNKAEVAGIQAEDLVTDTPEPTDTPYPTPTPNLELDNKIIQEQANIEKYKAEDKRLSNEINDALKQLNDEISLNMVSFNRPNNTASYQAKADGLISLWKLNQKALVAAEYRLDRLELAKKGDFAGVEKLTEEEHTSNIESQQSEIISNLEEINRKLKR